MITGIPHFTIFLGSPTRTPRLDEHDRVSVIHKISRRFDRFTISEGRGFFNGRFEDVLLIHVVTDDVEEIAGLAEDLRITLYQEGVGIETAGRYYRATAETCPGQLTEALRSGLQGQ